MKRKNLLASGLAITLAAGLGFGFQHVSADDDKVPADTKVNLNQAIDNASKEQAGTVTSVELDTARNGQAYYEVDVNDDKAEYDIRVNADDGTVESRKDNDDDDNNQALQPKVDIKTAAETALAQEKGATLTDISLDEDDGRLEYDVELRTDKDEIEVTVDAESGEVTYTEKESIHDDQDDDDGDDD